MHLLNALENIALKPTFSSVILRHRLFLLNSSFPLLKQKQRTTVTQPSWVTASECFRELLPVWRRIASSRTVDSSRTLTDHSPRTGSTHCTGTGCRGRSSDCTMSCSASFWCRTAAVFVGAVCSLGLREKSTCSSFCTVTHSIMLKLKLDCSPCNITRHGGQHL